MEFLTFDIRGGNYTGTVFLLFLYIPGPEAVTKQDSEHQIRKALMTRILMVCLCG